MTPSVARIDVGASDAQARTLMVVESVLCYAQAKQHFIQLIQRLWPKTTWYTGHTHLRLFPNENDKQENVFVEFL